MKLRLSLNGRSILTILVIAMLGVGLACAGEKATPTSPPTATLAPTATATTAPTATLVPTATATLVPGEPTPTATAVPTATATAIPEPTATAVPLTWIEKYMQSPGYKPEWGQPQRGGIYKMGLSRNPFDFLANNASTTNAAFNHPIYNPLIRMDPWIGFEGIIPDLAKSWEWSSDFLHMTMKLEEGVKFQNNPNIPERLRNADFTCEDVQASVERHVRPPKWETRINDGKANLWPLNGVSCPDGPRGYTAVLNFDLPLAKTMAALAQGTLVMFDKEFIDWMNTEKPAVFAVTTPEAYLFHTGSGPFVPKEWVPDVIGKMRRNPTYWREGLPLLDGIDQYILKDYTTRFTALITGQINYFGHGSYTLLPGQVAQAQRDFPDRVVIYPTLHNFAYGAVFNLARPPYDDRRVRKAMSLAIDRDDWLLFKRSGSYPGALLAGNLVPGTYWSYTEAELRTWPGIRQPHAQDVAEANRLLDEVFGKGKRFKTSCMGGGQDYFDVCLFFIDQMKRHLNVDVAMDNVEVAVASTRSEAGQFDMSGSSPGMSVLGDPDDDLLLGWHRKYSTSKSTVRALAAAAAAEPVLWPELEALIDQQTREMDPVKRKELVQKIEWMLYDQAIYKVPFGWNYTFPAVTPNVKGFYAWPLWVRTHYAIYERLWLAK